MGRLEAGELELRRQDALQRVWHVKGWEGLGADDCRERVEALDLLGVARQLVFPPVTWPTIHGTDVEAMATLR